LPFLLSGVQAKVVEYTNPMIAMGAGSPRRTLTPSPNASSVSEGDRRFSHSTESPSHSQPAQSMSTSTPTNQPISLSEDETKGLDCIIEEQEEDNADSENKRALEQESVGKEVEMVRTEVEAVIDEQIAANDE